jgi:hypothetical protein
MTQHTYNDLLLVASQATVKSLLDELFLMDGEIEKWAEQLNRAQPLLSGRVVIAFTNDQGISHGGDRHRMVMPKPAKMIRVQSGQWKRVWLTKAQMAKGIVELRVGKSLPSDRVVVRLLKGIDDLMQRRNTILSILMEMRSKAVFAKNACANARIRSDEALDKLKARIKTDWTTDAPQALENLRNRKHNEYIRAKASAELKRRLALEPPPAADTADTTDTADT